MTCKPPLVALLFRSWKRRSSRSLLMRCRGHFFPGPSPSMARSDQRCSDRLRRFQLKLLKERMFMLRKSGRYVIRQAQMMAVVGSIWDQM